MVNIDKIGAKVETLIEKIKSLKYKFNDVSLETDADNSLEESIASLENWLELVTNDYENGGETPQEDEEKD
jgi:hypothetical protein